MRRLVGLAAPVLLLVAVAAVGSLTTAARQLEFENALVKAAIVIALYVFIGNSGVVSGLGRSLPTRSGTTM